MGFKLIPTYVGYNETNVNCKNTGSTLIFTNPASSGQFFPSKIRVYGGNLVGIVTPPTLSIGTNASSYNNILVATALTGLTNTGYIDYAITFPGTLLTAGTGVFVNVTIAANATTYGVRFGVFVDNFL
jgi:hypothetical protein